MQPNQLEIADLVTFTEEILNGKLHFLCSACTSVAIRALTSQNTIFCCGRASPANIYAISIQLCDSSSFNVLTKSQIGGCVCLNMVEKPICLRPDYAYSTSREGKSAADVGPFSTLQFN